MGMRQLEAAVLAELRRVVGKASLKQKDILAWSTGKEEARPGEVVVFLPELKINVVVSQDVPKKKA